MILKVRSAIRAKRRRWPLSAKIALGFILLVVLVAAFAHLLAPFNPLQTYTPARPPSLRHLFGTDITGRDILSRLLYGSRDSLIIGVGSTVIALVIASVLGGVAATSSKVLDELIMRACDVEMAFPGIALAAVLVTAFGSSLFVLVCTIAFLYIPPLTRVVRANVMAQYGEDYVNAEAVIGASKWYILRRHVAINSAAPILVVCTLMVANAIVFEASLSFIGAGVQPPNPSWGNVMASGRDLVLAGGWWATVFPGVLILLTVLALNILAEGMSDAWASPSVRTADPAVNTAVSEDERNIAAGSLIELPASLTVAADRLRERARPLTNETPLLQVRDLSVTFPHLHQGIAVVDSVSFDVRPGEILGLVGESGCGKSLLSMSVMGLEPSNSRLSGSILFEGKELLGADKRTRQQLRGRDMAIVHQDALSSLNPAMTVMTQLKQLTSRGGTRTPAELLELVGLEGSRTLRSYPHELSGGQRQRVLIAMALSREPKLLIADEPTTALDVTVQARVMQLLLRLREELGFAIILVSHDLALVADVTDRVIVMYGGEVAEGGVTADIVGMPAHHYTRGLLSSVLSIESQEAQMIQIPGVVPSPTNFPAGCRFSDRCPAASTICREVRPELAGDLGRHIFACHHPILTDVGLTLCSEKVSS